MIGRLVQPLAFHLPQSNLGASFFFVVVFLSSLLSLVFQTKGEKMLRIHNIFEASDAAGECVR